MTTLKLKELLNNGKLSERQLLARTRMWLAIFISGVFLSGFAFIPIEKLMLLIHGGIHAWAPMGHIKSIFDHFYDASLLVQDNLPFLAYRRFWMAFARIAVALFAIAAFINPVRNRMVIDIAAVLALAVVPLSLLHGIVYHVPVFWILTDCAMALCALLPLAFCRRNINRLTYMEYARLTQLY
jgi:hypothetical protein